MYASTFLPLSERQSFTIEFDYMIATAVICVLLRSDKSAIAWIIPLIIVNSINAEIVRITIHQRPFFEVQIFHPTFTNFNSAATIIMEINRIFIRASSFDVDPYRICPSDMLTG